MLHPNKYTKEVKRMKIAIPLTENILCAHFGLSEQFGIYAIEDNKIIDTNLLVPPPHQPGVLPKWLQEQGVDVIIASGMGGRAQDLFNQHTEAGTMLKGLRAREGLSQKQLAEKLGTEQPNISNMEHGKRPIGKNMAKKIAKIFDIDYRLFL